MISVSKPIKTLINPPHAKPWIVIEGLGALGSVAIVLGDDKLSIESAQVAKESKYSSTILPLIKKLLSDKADVVMSDMAINTTGIKNIDSIQTGELCKDAMTFSKDVISSNGFFISKIFMGGSFNEIVELGKKIFKDVKVFKPKSSRKDSKESFIICKNLR